MNAELLSLIQALGAAITPANIDSAVSLVEKLVSLAETLKTDIDSAVKPAAAQPASKN